MTLDELLGYICSKIILSLSVRLKEDAFTLAKRHKERGTRKIKESNFRAGLREFENSLAYNQNDERLIFLTGVLTKKIEKENIKLDSLFAKAEHYRKKGWSVYAIVVYKEVLEIDKNNKKAKNQIAALKSNLSKNIRELFSEGRRYYNNNKLEDAKNKFKYILLADEKHAGAIQYLAKIDSVTSHLTNEYYYRGLGYYNQRRLEKSKDVFQKVLEINPAHREAKYYINKIDHELKENEKLINKLFEEANSLERRGKYVLASSKYREILSINRDFEKASQQLDLLQAYINVIVNRKFNRAKKLFDKEKYSEAQAAFKDILSIKPTHRQSKYYLRRIKEAQSDKIDQHFQQANIYFNNRRWTDALKELEMLLVIYPDHQDALNMQSKIWTNIELDEMQKKGLQLFNKGTYIRALKLFNLMLDKDPDNVIAKSYINECRIKLNKRISEYFNSGMRFYIAGNYEAAIREWDRILDIDPNHESALEYKKRASERLQALERLQ